MNNNYKTPNSLSFSFSLIPPLLSSSSHSTKIHSSLSLSWILNLLVASWFPNKHFSQINDNFFIPPTAIILSFKSIRTSNYKPICLMTIIFIYFWKRFKSINFGIVSPRKKTSILPALLICHFDLILKNKYANFIILAKKKKHQMLQD